MSNYTNRNNDFEFDDDMDSSDALDSTPPRPMQAAPRRLPRDEIPMEYGAPLIDDESEPDSRYQGTHQSTRANRSQAAYPPYNNTASANTAPPAKSRRYPLPEPTVPPNLRQSSRRSKTSVNKHDSGLYLPWWSLLILVLFVGGAAIGAWAIVGALSGDNIPGGETPVVIVVTSASTPGLPPTPTSIPVQASITPLSQLPTIAPTTTLPAGIFQAGATVKVIGVGQAGLNVRAGPGTDSPIRFQAPEEERFILREQPQTASGIEWWFIQSPTDETRSGWASRQYLEVVTVP